MPSAGPTVVASVTPARATWTATLRAALDLRASMEAAFRRGDRKLIELLDAQKAYQDRLGHVIEFESFYWRSLNRLNAAVGLKAYDPDKGPLQPVPK